MARGTVYHAVELGRLIEKAIQKKGFSVVEAVSYCPTTYGRLNKLGSAVDMMRGLKENSITVQQAARLPHEETQGKIVRGVLLNRDTPEYTEEYERIIARAQARRAVEEHSR